MNGALIRVDAKTLSELKLIKGKHKLRNLGEAVAAGVGAYKVINIPRPKK